VAWWVETLLPVAFAVCIAYTVFVLAGRRADWPPLAFALAGGCGALIIFAFSFVRARRHFISEADARAQLDSALLLNSRLTSASNGIGTWPDVGLWRVGALRWNYRRLTTVPMTCVGLIAAAFFIGIPVAPKPLPVPTAKPPALSKVEDWLEKLSQSKAIDQSSLEQVRQEAQQLAKQQAGDWYSHSSLEAGDHLKSQMEAGLKTLEQNATKIESLLGGAGNPQMTDEEAKALGSELGSALSALEGNVPSLDRSLTGKLRNLDPSKLHSLSREQVEALKKALKEGSGACKKCMGEGDPVSDGDGEKTKSGGDSDQSTGNGGPGGGGGPPGLSFGEDPVQLGSKGTKGVHNDDFSQAGLGERVGVSAGQHDVDRNAEHHGADGGAVSGDGNGASAVWIQQNLTPQERKQLQEYFK